MSKEFYKILTPEEWERASETGIIETDLDIKDGFIHLSTSRQLAATLAFYFADHEVQYLVTDYMLFVNWGFGYRFEFYYSHSIY